MWRTVLFVILAETWRWPIAFCTALYVSGHLMSSFTHAIWLPVTSPHKPGFAYGFALSLLSFVATLLWVTALFTLVRSGLRARLFHLSLALATLASLLIYFSWLPVLVSVLILLTLALCNAAFFYRPYQPALLASFFAVLAGLATTASGLYLANLYRLHLIPGLVSSANLEAHPSIQWIDTLISLLIVTVTAQTAQAANHRLITRLVP